jgi:hypothetical protein
MVSFQVCDALSILFELEKPHVEYLESFILLLKVASCRIFSELLTGNSNSRTPKNSPTRSTKANASIVGGMFAITTMNC